MMDEAFLRYNALDSACMLEIHNKFWDDLDREGFLHTYQMTIDLFPVLTFMQEKGMKVSHTLLEVTKKDVLERAAVLQLELDKIVGGSLNVNSSKQCAAYFYDRMGCTVITDTKTKKATTNDMAMQRLVRGTAKQKGLRAAKLVQEIRGLQKLYSTYLNITFDHDDRMRGSYNPRGTKFGRLSSSKTIFDTGMNFQNLPPEFKKFLVADDGYFLLEVDKSQAEWVVVAYSSNDVNMIQAVESRQDVHSFTASKMFNVPIDIVKYENKVLGHESNPDIIMDLRMNDSILEEMYTDKWPRGMSLRQCGKKSNHGLNYDEGFMQFALQNEMPPVESKKIVNMYHGGYPGIRKGYDVTKRQLQNNRTLQNCFGRKVRFMGEWGSDLWKSSYSFIPQSTVVDSLNQGMVKIYGDNLITGKDGWNLDILAQVHDSILMQFPISSLTNEDAFESFLAKVYQYVSPTLSYNGNDFKIATDCKVGFNWGGFDKESNKEGMRDYKNKGSLKDLLLLRNTDGTRVK
jgi:DNA polymerase I-like protein with 3'-5' exonuclease and polymerase domains